MVWIVSGIATLHQHRETLGRGSCERMSSGLVSTDASEAGYTYAVPAILNVTTARKYSMAWARADKHLTPG